MCGKVYKRRRRSVCEGVRDTYVRMYGVYGKVCEELGREMCKEGVGDV